jgi:hypothetical protein
MNSHVVPLRASLLALAISFLLLPVPEPAGAETQFGVSVFGGYNSYAMDDANELVDQVNDALAGTGYSMDEISSGFAYGGGVRIRPSTSLMIALDYERLNASSELSIFDFDFELEVPADAFTGTLIYLFPSTSRARFGIGAGLGYYSSSGSLSADSSGVGIETDVEGSGIGFHGLGALDLAVSPVVHLEGMAGYRFAQTSDIEVAGDTAYNSEGEEATLDWSGFMSRVGLTFYFGAGAPSP